jgi:putative radical SAM enzyme (TIGR03279 family)
MPTRGKAGVEIEQVRHESLSEQCGLMPGDRLISINGNRIADTIDLLFYGSELSLLLEVDRQGQRMAFETARDESSERELGIGLKHFRVKTCRNKCVFCFVAQLPRGLRKALYVRDEDYRMSFLYGSYITLTNLTEDDRKRIVEQRLSPLYISVHSTDRELRNRLIGNPHAPDLTKEIKFFADHRIRMHTQIVLCPGYNDGDDLAKTVATLYRFYPYVSSIAVVPVGLTEHRKKPLRPVGKEDAAAALRTIHRFQARFRRKHGESIVYGSDELYIKADEAFPSLDVYDDLPQVENGVGMVPRFLREAKRIKVPVVQPRERVVTFTGTSFYPFLWKFMDRLRRIGYEIDLVSVANSFFGESVTVTGLLTGRDVIKALSEVVRPGDVLLIPDVVMREGQEVFLDDVSRQDLEEFLKVRSEVIESTPAGLLEALRGMTPVPAGRV